MQHKQTHKSTSKLKLIILLLMFTLHTIADLLITSISIGDDTISKNTIYNFQIVRFGASSFIPNGTILVINFPNGYLNNGMVTGCIADGWTGASILSCSYSQYKLTISGGFPVISNLQNFGVNVSGIINPVAANQYSPFTVNLVFPNGTTQAGTGAYAVTITTALANCSMTLSNGLVFGQGLITINYLSQYINSSNVGYTMKLSMLQSYPDDPTNTDINPILSVSNNMLATYLFQFSFINTFNISMLMPPSTQPQPNFIFILTSNILGDYDKCYITISGVQPNNFVTLSITPVQVQSLSNLAIDFLSITPILTSDIVRINFTNTDFDISQVLNYATFTRGIIGQKSVTKSGQILTIRNIASFVIVSQIGFYLSGVKFPYSTKPQRITIFIQTDNGYVRNSQIYTYSSIPGNLTNSTYACLLSQIGYTTTCTLNIITNNQITDTSYIQLKYPSNFIINNGYTQCTSSGINLNTICNCNLYSINNTIRVSNMISTNSIIVPGSALTINIPNFKLPNIPGNYKITITTHTQDGYAIDTADVYFLTLPRALLVNQVVVSSSSMVTNAVTNYTVTLTLPISLGIPYTFGLYIPFTNITVPSVNSNLLTSTYSLSTQILTITNVANTQLLITGFLTYQSTKPITLSGNLTYNNILYFYFQGYDITMQQPKQINVFNITQSNSIVGKIFKADIIISDLAQYDVISIPQFYAITQNDCSNNCNCGSNGNVIVNVANGYGNNLTLISVNLVNIGYVASQSFDLVVKAQGGIFLKQITTVTIRTQVTNILNISVIQSNPYYTQSSTYSFNVSMTTFPPANSLNNLLQVTIPSQYVIQTWNCIVGCITPTTPPVSGSLYFSISSTSVSFTIKLINPVAFLSSIQMTSISLGNMDYGAYLPVTPCSVPCRSCASNSSSYCLTCYQWSSQNKLRNGTCVSDCAAGQYYDNSTLSCKICHSYCLSCVNTSTTCYTCKPTYYYFQFSCLVTCPISYYPTATGQCSPCSSGCLNCISSTNCTLCNNSTYLYQYSCWASCQQGTFINPLLNQCLNCSLNCISCDSTGCSQCKNNYYLYNKLCYLQCPSGLFKSVNTCVPCQNPCLSCSIYATNCTSCVTHINTTYYYYLSNVCYQNTCPDTYYINSINNVCTACQSPCKTCNRTQCITCQTGLYFYSGFCSITCQNGTYPVTTNMSCVVCPIPCATCQTATSCLSCISPYILYSSTCILNCPDSFYQNTNTNICNSCQIPCLTCTSLTVCKSCLTLNYFNGTCYTSCPSGLYSSTLIVLNQTVKQCISCGYPCATCTSNTSCLSCLNNLKLYNSGCQVNCPTQFYDSNGICFACSYPCLTCNSNGCLTCADTQLYLQRQQCLPQCTDLHPNNLTMQCQNCAFPCGTCTWYDTCLSCLTPYIYYQGVCINACPTGKYNSNQVCIDCPANCSTCYLASDQVRCQSCLTGNYFYGYSCVNSCPSSTTLSDPYCLSNTCTTLTNCSTCSNFRCIECQTNFTLNSTTGKCQAIIGQTSIIASVSEIPVPFPFLIATIVIIISAFLIRLQFNKMFTPLFIYSFVGIAEAGNFALWLALIYTKGIDQFQTGVVLKVVASIIIGLYVSFNVIAFILYIRITRNDRKFRVWQKQDNKCASILISIIALILSFRFSLLKYSKLGHLQKFSATLSHDSKLNYQNVMSYLSIVLINVPIIVIAAWISYLQTKMNYLFFTSLQIAVISVIMIILSIIQSLSPKGYTLEKKQQFKQGFDADGIDQQSLSEMMVKMGIVQEEYHENKEIMSEDGQVGNKNIFRQEDDLRSPKTTLDALIFTKAEDEKLSIQSDIPPSLLSQQQSEPFSSTPILPVNIKDEKQQLLNILMQAQKREQQFNKPIRPVGTIRKQTLPQFQDNQSSQQIQSDDEPPPINSGANSSRKNNQKLRKEQTMNLNDLKSFLDVEQRRLGMRRLQHLFQKLKLQQKQQQQLRQRLQKIAQQQKILKKKQYEKARQTIQRNQMNVQQKLSKVQQLMNNRNKLQKQRKQKIKQMELKRKQDRTNRVLEQSQKIALVYPINQQLIQQQKQKYSQKYKQKPKNNIKEPVNVLSAQVQLKQDDVQWVQDQQRLNFQATNDWKIGQQKLPSQYHNQSNKNLNTLRQDITQPFQQVQIDHWPIDTQLQYKINEVQQRAQRYLSQQRRASSRQVQQFDIDLQSDTGTGAQQFIFKDEGEQMYEDDVMSQKLEQAKIILNIDENVKIPKKRVNRSIIDLSPK